MSGLNRFVGIGRLTKDVEVRKTSSGLSVANFTLAVNSRVGKEEKTDFISCIAWRQTADFLGQYAKKGNFVSVEGRIQTRSYDGEDGKKVYVTEVVANSVKLFSNKSDGQSQAAATPAPVADEQEVVENIETIDLGNGIDINDDDLPF